MVKAEKPPDECRALDDTLYVRILFWMHHKVVLVFSSFMSSSLVEGNLADSGISLQRGASDGHGALEFMLSDATGTSSG